jgi:hypothetical protein
LEQKSSLKEKSFWEAREAATLPFFKKSAQLLRKNFFGARKASEARETPATALAA